MARVHVHMIADDALMNDLSVATKVVPNAYIISTLKKAGEEPGSRKGFGIITWRTRGKNQRGDVVIEFDKTNLLRCRHPQEEAQE